ncbi:diguanylate cyclase domain-containing protein [Streptomyces nojiriensis]|uniref:diguanylate cyclase domain-containing protein n=1 Tax=Streptomyces nojiriensis TaxID=66374 RepID=UPI0036D821A3
MEVSIMTPHPPPELVRENDFKSLNDTHGHAAGDAVFAATARALDGLRGDDGRGLEGMHAFLACGSWQSSRLPG